MPRRDILPAPRRRSWASAGIAFAVGAASAACSTDRPPDRREAAPSASTVESPQPPEPSHIELTLTMPVAHQVMDVALSPLGDRVVVADMEGAIDVWDVPSRRSLGRFETRSKRPCAMALSRDGARVSVWGRADSPERLLEVHAVPSGALLSLVEPRRSCPRSLAPEGKLALFNNEVFDGATGEYLSTLEDVPDRTDTARFYDSGARVLLAFREGPPDLDEPGCVLHTFDARTGRRLGASGASKVCPDRIAISRDGRRAAALSPRSVRFWDLSSMTESASLDVGEAVYGVALNGDATIAITVGRSLCLWDTRGPTQIECVHQEKTLTSVSISEDEHFVLAASTSDARLFELPPRSMMRAPAATALPASPARNPPKDPSLRYETHATWTARPTPTTPPPTPIRNGILLGRDVGSVAVELADGDYVYSTLKGEVLGILRTPLKGGASEALILGSAFSIRALAADDDRIYWIDRYPEVSGPTTKARIVAISKDGGAIETLARDLPANADGLVVDGNDLVWCARIGDPTDGVWRMPRTGGTPSQIYKGGVDQCVVPSKGGLLFTEESPAGGRVLGRISPGGGPPERTPLPLDDPPGYGAVKNIHWLTATQDGEIFLALWSGQAPPFPRKIIERSESGSMRLLFPIRDDPNAFPFAFVLDKDSVIAAVYDLDLTKHEDDRASRLVRLSRSGASSESVLTDLPAAGRVRLVGTRAGVVWSNDAAEDGSTLWLLRAP